MLGTHRLLLLCCIAALRMQLSCSEKSITESCEQCFIWADHVLVSDATLFPSSQRRKFSLKKVAVFGDSLARRLTATIAMYLNVTEDARTVDVDFGDASLLGQGWHSLKHWGDDIEPFQSTKIVLSFFWQPVFPSLQPRTVERILTEFDTFIYLVSTFWQADSPLGVPSSPVDWSKSKKYVQKLCVLIAPGNRLIMGLSPAGDLDATKPIKKRSAPRLAKLKALNSRQGKQKRLSNIKRFNQEYHDNFREMCRDIASCQECRHVLIKFLDHFALFNKRTDGRHRDSGDSQYHLGNIARIYRALDIFKIIH